MIRSMTGFGRCEKSDDAYKFTVEIKSVNHRYFDANIRMPRKLVGFENEVRGLLKKKIERGKIDVYVNYENLSQASETLCYREAVAAGYVSYLTKMSETFSIPNDLSASVLARCPEVLTMEEAPEDEEGMWKLLRETVESALAQFIEAREREGEHLRADLQAKLANMDACVDRIEQKAPGLVEDYRARLTAKIQEVLADTNIDEGRIATEVTIFADKICVDEETVRLRSHIRTARNTLEQGGSVGKRLDFVAQEMNREANTILSKSNDLEITNIGITLKTEIEKVREQIQNLE